MTHTIQLFYFCFHRSVQIQSGIILQIIVIIIMMIIIIIIINNDNNNNSNDDDNNNNNNDSKITMSLEYRKRLDILVYTLQRSFISAKKYLALDPSALRCFQFLQLFVQHTMCQANELFQTSIRYVCSFGRISSFAKYVSTFERTSSTTPPSHTLRLYHSRKKEPRK